MVLAVTTPTVSSYADTTASVSSTGATGGTGPYTYQWYRDTSGSGFTPGGGNIVTGATSLTLNDTGLIPNTVYYYKLRATDTGHSNDTADSTALAVTTTPGQLSQNQFAQSPTLGQIDMRFDYNTLSAQLDSTQATSLYAGAFVKIVDSAGGVPKVIGCTATTDEAFGVINYDIKNVAFTALQACEISQQGNVVFLYAGGAIGRGVQVCMANPAVSQGTVVAIGSASSGDKIVGWALDKAAAYGDLIRVRLGVPSFTVK